MGRLQMLASALIMHTACICGAMVAAAAATSTSSGGRAHYKLKTPRITLYAQEVVTQNSFRVLEGIPEATEADVKLHFGDLFVVNYQLFPAFNFTDAATAQGTLSGTHTIVSYNGRDVLFHHSIALKDPLPVGTLTVSGVFSYLDPSIPVPIVGGTGAYSLLDRGTLTVTPISFGVEPFFYETFRLDIDVDLLDEHLLLA